MNKNEKKTSIGGQAVIEGIMMRGPHKSALTVRLSNGNTDTEVWDTYKNGKKPKLHTIPFVRGIFNMIDTLKTGFDCLTKSAEKSGIEEDEPNKFEKWISDKLKIKVADFVNFIAIVFGIGLAILLFIVVPTAVTFPLKKITDSTFLITLAEGFLKILIFLLYLFLCSRNKDVARVFEYHGAEHKTIACYEAGEELTPENCKKYTRFHPRCGTSFILIVLVVSILVISFVPTLNPFLRMAVKLLLLPVIVGISYEFIKLTGRYTNACTKFFSAPGLWLQRLTTREPDLEQLAVAIEAMKAVIPENKDDDNY